MKNATIPDVFSGYDIVTLPTINGNDIVWSEELGIGYLPSNSTDAEVYDSNYWKSYVEKSNTPIGWALNGARMHLTDMAIAMLDAKTDDECMFGVLDVGIGSGAFVERYGAYGFDVNPVANAWLKENKLFQNPYKQPVEIATMWDVIEHIDNPTDLLSNVTDAVVLSTPIYKSFTDCLKSKHYKPNEHIWYFTSDGLVRYMEFYGFTCYHEDYRETEIGRESIGSFIFLRNKYNMK